MYYLIAVTVKFWKVYMVMGVNKLHAAKVNILRQ